MGHRPRARRTEPCFSISDICRLIEKPVRAGNYLRECWILPRGLTPMGSGHGYRMDPGQAMWFALALEFYGINLRPHEAASMANFAELAMQQANKKDDLDPGFHPFKGYLRAKYEWLAGGDGVFNYLETNATTTERGGRVYTRLRNFQGIVRHKFRYRPDAQFFVSLTGIARALDPEP